MHDGREIVFARDRIEERAGLTALSFPAENGEEEIDELNPEKLKYKTNQHQYQTSQQRKCHDSIRLAGRQSANSNYVLQAL